MDAALGGGTPELDAPGAPRLPEARALPWRAPVDEAWLTRQDRRWTRSQVGQLLPFLVTAAGMLVLSWELAPMSAIALGFAWLIPSLWAAKGAAVLGDARPGLREPPLAPGAESRALGLLADVAGAAALPVLRETGFVVAPGRLGVWVVGPVGALLVRGRRGRRVECWCVRATGEPLPRADRIAHLLLALRADESGFATVANLSFSGARWRVRRRLREPGARAALDAAVAQAQAARGGSAAPGAGPAPAPAR